METNDFDHFIKSHHKQLSLANIPEIFWQTLYFKLTNETFDAGNVVNLVKCEYDEERKNHEPVWALQAVTNIKIDDKNNIYLIDHAWTYRLPDAQKQLLQYETLRSRLCKILDIDSNLFCEEELVNKIFHQMWKINNFYSIKNVNVEDNLPIWYVMDEIGSAVLHNDEPNVRIVPFIHVKNKMTYSLLFPIHDILSGGILYRDFAEGTSNPIKRKAMVLPWVPSSFSYNTSTVNIPESDYFLNGHVEESLPNISNFKKDEKIKNNYKVFSQYSLINTYLNDGRFSFVDDDEEADILWFVDHFKDFKKLSQTPSKFINQFPFEFILTVKDLLCLTCRRFRDPNVLIPTTYILETEIGNFISYYQQRERENLENFWIIKPFNLARGLDIHITNNLFHIVRLLGTGPKIIQKYITNPVLFFRSDLNARVKFDLRYIILLKSVRPLKAYVYKNFFLRFANKQFTLNNLNDYETHFTVMNYKENTQLKRMLCHEFIKAWKDQFPEYPWDDIESSILLMFRNLLEIATDKCPPCGIAESPQSRAAYAADIMLEWNGNEIKPKTLEINFTPDCKRACEYYPDFYNKVFTLLFLNENENAFHRL